MANIARSGSISVMLALLILSTTHAQDCPCDSVKSSYGLLYIFLDNPPGVTEINRDLQRIGYPQLDEEGITLLSKGESLISAIRGLELLYLPNTRLGLTHGSLSGTGTMDSLHRTNLTQLSYYRLDATYEFPLIATGGFTAMPTVGLGQELANLSLERLNHQGGSGKLDEYLDDRSASFWEYGVSIDLGVRAA